MNPAIEQAVADAIPHTGGYHKTGGYPPYRGGPCVTGKCVCGAEKRRNVLLSKISRVTSDGYVYLRTSR